MPRRSAYSIALAAFAVTVAAAHPAFALPRSVASFVLGPAMVRADVVARDSGVVHLYRVDRGRIRSLGAGSLVLRERDGANVTVPIAGDAVVTGVKRGRQLGVLALRRGMVVSTVRDGNDAAERVQVLRAALPLPPALVSSLFAAKMARADIVVQSAGASRLYRVDRGRIRSIGADSVALRERDGTLQTIPIDEDAVVTGIGRGRLRRGVLAALKRNMLIETVREGDQPADHVHVTG